MASIYYIDFPMTVYQSFTIEAESESEARAIANALRDSEDFLEDHIFDEFDCAAEEDVGKPSVVKALSSRVLASLTKDDINQYIEEG